MVVLRKRRIGKQEFYYLEHTLRVKNKVVKKEKYIGKEIPKNIEERKKEFFREVFKNKYDKLDKVKKNFNTKFRKMPKEVREKYLERFMLKFTYDSNRIEGSSLSEREVVKLLHDHITPANKPVADIKEADNHKKVFYEMLKYNSKRKLRVVNGWHRMMFEETKPGVAGKLRTYNIKIHGSSKIPSNFNCKGFSTEDKLSRNLSYCKTELPHWNSVKRLLMQFFRWYEGQKIHPVELAALVHYTFVCIHPFGDGNGRMSRMLMNFVLHRNGFPMLNIGYENRDSYYNALERADVSGEMIFVKFILDRYLKEYAKYT